MSHKFLGIDVGGKDKSFYTKLYRDKDESFNILECSKLSKTADSLEELTKALITHFREKEEQISKLNSNLAMIYVNLFRHQDKDDLKEIVKELLIKVFPEQTN